MNLNQVANRREQVLFSFFVLVFLMLFFRTFYASQVRKVREVQKKIESVRLEKEALERFAATAPVFKREQKLSARREAKIKVLYGEVESDYEDIGALLAKISEPDFMRRSSLQKINLSDPKPGQGYVATDFTLSLVGNFSDMIQSLEKMEQFPALFRLENVVVKSVEGRPQDLEAEVISRFFKLDSQATEAPGNGAQSKETPKATKK
jgi:Tfp pilus assembly protein PilO